MFSRRIGRLFTLLVFSGSGWGQARHTAVHGAVLDPQGRALSGVIVTVVDAKSHERQTVTTQANGAFQTTLSAQGDIVVTVHQAGFQNFEAAYEEPDEALVLHLTAALATVAETVTVSTSINDTSLTSPDPAQQIYVHDALLDANPGRPGAPLSIPGVPIETASGGIKAPQYFVAGVAGDHGEPIAQYITVGSFLVPNNLSANAHGNGYADPNTLIPATLAGVRTDAGAFNVLEGNHALNFAAAYEPKTRLERFATLTGDYRDADLVVGLSPHRTEDHAWLAFEAAYGNGLLHRLEHRQQYKLNGLKNWQIGDHSLTLFAIAYSGRSCIPGLVPLLAAADSTDTVDDRQRDQTHTGEIAANDRWRISPSQQLSVSGMVRTYNLALYSNFGDGLIRQSEFRTVEASNASYTKTLNEHIALLVGADEDRDAPRRIELDHYLSLDPAVYGPFVKVTENNLTLNDFAPFTAVSGSVLRFFRYYLGWRRDEVEVTNEDLVDVSNSFQHREGVNNPKGTLSFTPSARLWLPTISFSMGEAFFTNDPRIGSGAERGSSVERSHSAQLVLEKVVARTDLKLTLNRTTEDQTLAKLDADTGLQEDEGPSKLRSLTAMATHYFSFGFLQVSLAKADARDRDTGEPTPEAPRTIVDVLGTIDRLPWGLQARSEFEYVGHKPLGDGFEAVPVKELRGALVKRLHAHPLELGLNFLLASGYTGQTTEDLPSGYTLHSGIPGCPATLLNCPTAETPVGVRLPSFVGGSVSWHFTTRK